EIPEVCELPFFTFTYTEAKDNKILLSRFYPPKTKNQITSDYEGEKDLTVYQIFYHNLYCLLHDKQKQIKFYSERVNEILNPVIENIESRIDYFYDNLKTRIECNTSFPISLIEKYITCSSAEEVLSQRKNCSTIIQTQKQIAKSLIDKYMNINRNITWLDKNPTTQINYSFNPIIEEPKKWYGKYFAE
ncbi:MAG: Acanthamoeba polyphaga mimivirus, partial [Bacteroidota bacterium]